MSQSKALRRRSSGAQRPTTPSRSHALRHVSILAPELGVHVVLTHLAVIKLATPAVTLRAVLAEATEDGPAASASTGKRGPGGGHALRADLLAEPVRRPRRRQRSCSARLFVAAAQLEG